MAEFASDIAFAPTTTNVTTTGRTLTAAVTPSTTELTVPTSATAPSLPAAAATGRGPGRSAGHYIYRAMADNSVGRVIETLLRNDVIVVDEVGFAPLDDTGTQLLFRFVAAAYERRSLAIASHWSFGAWGRFLPEHTTAVSILDRLLHHATVVVTSGDSLPRARVPPTPRRPPHQRLNNRKGWGLSLGHQRGLPPGH